MDWTRLAGLHVIQQAKRQVNFVFLAVGGVACRLANHNLNDLNVLVCRVPLSHSQKDSLIC